MNAKILSIRVIRKSSHLLTKTLHRGLRASTKVEDKATKILTGVDFSVEAFKEVSFEKVFYNGIPYNIAPLNPALPALNRTGTVTLLIPSLTKSSFYGGTATALIVAGKIALKTNKPLRIIETLQPGGKEGLGNFFKDNGIKIKEDDVELIDVSSRRYNVYGYVDIHSDDLFIASAWWDAYLLNQLPLPRKFIYLIQDFEPIFYANSDKYVLAENTYKSESFIPLCNTELMYDFLSERYPYIKKTATWFEPAVSQGKKGYSIKNTDKKRIFLYGRPNVERNLFYSALHALEKIFASSSLNNNDWEIFLAGQDKIPTITLSSGMKITNLGKMSVKDYYKFARSVDLTISPMMAPHPNYPTLELASIGSAVVTTKYENKQDLSKYSDNIFMADLSLESIIEATLKASKLSHKQRLENAKASHILDSWNDALDKPIEVLLKKFS